MPCKTKCYARKFYKWPTVRQCWGGNWELWQADPEEFKRQFLVDMDVRQPAYFRWFVSGDIPNADFLQFMYAVALRYQDTRFMAYTKNFPLLEDAPDPPGNLSILLSKWDGDPYDITPLLARFPVFWFWGKNAPLEHGTDKNSFICPGSCRECHKCWRSTVRDVIIIKEH